MKTVELDLEELYFQKQKLEEKIKELDNFLKNQKSKDKKITLIYNSYEDKDYFEVLKVLKPIIKEIFILPLDDKRIVKKDILKKCIKELELIEIEKLAMDLENDYLVFGSFLVVENFLGLIGYENS